VCVMTEAITKYSHSLLRLAH